MRRKNRRRVYWPKRLYYYLFFSYSYPSPPSRRHPPQKRQRPRRNIIFPTYFVFVCVCVSLWLSVWVYNIICLWFRLYGVQKKKNYTVIVSVCVFELQRVITSFFFFLKTALHTRYLCRAIAGEWILCIYTYTNIP